MLKEPNKDKLEHRRKGLRLVMRKVEERKGPELVTHKVVENTDPTLVMSRVKRRRAKRVGRKTMLVEGRKAKQRMVMRAPYMVTGHSIARLLCSKTNRMTVRS